MDDDEEDYVFFGTPLPEMEDEATLRKKAGKELQVRDEKGRQRFHGAFTGGFSAGYFNTVGTKEGWAPTTFISSRGKTADRIQQNPEDFMDDEDFGEFGIATRKIHTTTNFQDISGEILSKRKYFDTDSIIPGEAPLKDIVQPVRESIGIIILKKLGWRQGQGIGPRIKKYNTGTKVYGCSPLPDNIIPEEDDPTAQDFTFAPEDTEEISYTPKDNYFGLGYTGLSKQSVLTAPVNPFSQTTTKSWLAKDKRKLKISGQAFGVGAFEDEDEDIYGKDDISQYDFSDLELRKPENSKTTEHLQLGNSQGVLQGFQLASQPPLVKKHYPPPTLPSNFKPMHLKSATSTQENTNIRKSRHALSASDRSIILGERKFQKISLNVPDTLGENQKSSLEMTHVPASSSSSFRPFPHDIYKQQRYEKYLKLKEEGDIRKLMQPSSMTEWEKEQELEEFAKASLLFKPLSNMLSSRFMSGSHLSVEQEITSALEKLKKENAEKQVVTKKNLVGTSNRKTFEWHPVSLLCKRMNVPNPYPNSDSGGTQKVLKGKSLFDDLSFSSEKPKSYEKKSSLLSVSSDTENKMKDSSCNLNEKQVADTPVSVKKNEDLSSENKKPSMDFFKDIFGSSSSEDEGDEKSKVDNEHSEKQVPKQNNPEIEAENVIDLQNLSNKESEMEMNQEKIATIINIKNSSANKKVGFGVFANIDLDALNQRKPSEQVCDSGISKSKKDIISDSKFKSNLENSDYADRQLESKDTYGPELPPNYSVDSTIVPAPSPYKASSKKHRKSKSSHKHKHHKHKHKKKKKKSSKRNSSSSSESSEDEVDDIPPSLIIEKIKKLQRRKS